MARASLGKTTPPAVSVAVLCAGGLSVSFTQTLVIPIQSELPRLLGASASSAPWVVTITLLAAAVSMVVAGRLADLVGKQRVLAVSAGLLVAGSLLCALSNTLPPMLVGRALQGISLGFVPVGISLIREITPRKMAPTALATMSATIGVGGAIGLPLAAWIVNAGSWHALFWVSTIVAGVVFLLTVVAIPHVHDGHGGRFDAVGALGLAVGLVAFLVGISKATDWGWGNARTLGALAAGVVVLAGWAAFELRQAEPLVDLRSSAKLPVLVTNIAAIAIGFGMMAQAIVTPQLLGLPSGTGYGLGQSIQAIGLWMAPAGVMMMLFAPISSSLISGIGPKATLMIGATVIGGGYVLGTLLMDAPWQLAIMICVSSAGVGIGYAAMPTLVLDATPPDKAAAAVGLNSLSRSVGTSVAAALMGTLLTSDTVTFGAAELPSRHAFTLCFIVGAAAALLGGAIAAFIPRSQPAAAPLGARPADDRPAARPAADREPAGAQDLPSAV